jgi:hypothetical protein
MEDLVRLVADSLARHGYGVSVDHRRLEWSRWFGCESSFSLLLVPSAPGLYALSEEVVAPGEIPSTGGKRMLALFQIAETEDLCVALSRLFAPRNPHNARLSNGRCFVRFALVADPQQRQVACESLNRWLASSAETVTSYIVAPVDGAGRNAACENHDLSSSCHPERSGEERNAVKGPSVGWEHLRPEPTFSQQATESRVGTPQCEPPPLPAGF